MQSQAACSLLQQRRPTQAARLAQPAAARQQRRPPPGGACRRVCAYQRGGSASSSQDDVSDIIYLAKTRMSRRGAEEAAPGAMPDFFTRLKQAWRVLFPEQPKTLTPKEEGKQRLRMILVADRVGMNEVTMEAMRERIIGAVSPYVEIESPDLVEVAVTTDVDLGAIYSVAVPVRRVKPAARVPLNDDGDITFHWDPTDEESDPASQFPYGT